MRRGDVIVCNHTSFLEVLVLSKRFSPAFVFVSDESAAKGLVRVCGLPGAVLRAFSAPLGALDSSVRLEGSRLSLTAFQTDGVCVSNPRRAS